MIFIQLKINGDSAGKTYRGAGMVSGNGSSRLLLDYKYERPQKYREILEHIFGTDGICVTHLKIEMGADINSSSGTEPCVKRYADEPADVSRGAGYILAADAKKINPEITLDMLFWSEPKWVTDAEDVYSARYLWYADTLRAAYDTYGLKFDYVSVSRNEREIDSEWIKYFAKKIKAEKDCPYDFSKIKIVAADEENSWHIADIMMCDEEAKNAVDVIGSHYTSFSTDNAKLLSDSFGKELWFSEGCPPMTYPAALKRFGKSSLAGANGVLDIVTRFAAMYPLGGMTLYEYQPVAAAYYDGVCYCHKALITANEPWSGYYSLDSGYFAAQFISAFFKKGWHFIDSACICDGEKDGHSLKNVTHCAMAAMSENGENYSIMLINPTEKNIDYELEFENIQSRKMSVYCLTDSSPFEKISDFSGNKITVSHFSIMIISTLDAAPKKYLKTKSEVLALPYSDNFNYGTERNVPSYTTNQGGAFELRDGVLTQMITPEIKAMEWGATPEPTTCFGDDRWYNYRVHAVCHFDKSNEPDENYMGIGARYFLACAGMSGYCLRFYESGKWEFYRNSEIISEGKRDKIEDYFSLEISCENEKISAKIASESIFEYTENLSEKAGIPAGRAALYSSYSKNYFSLINIVPIGEKYSITRFDDTDECFAYEGEWEHNLMSGFADYKRTISAGGAGSVFSVEFSGTSIALFGCTEDCVINTFIDGKPLAANVKINKCGSREIFFAADGLENKKHILSAEVVSGTLKIDGAQIEG